MTKNAFIGYGDHYKDASVLAATNEVATLPVANVQDSSVQKIFRGSTTTTTIDLTMSGNVSADLFGAFGVNLTSSSTFSFTASTSALGNTDQLNVTTQSTSVNTRFKLFLNVFASTVTARYWRLVLTDATLSNIDVGRLFLGPLVRPDITIGPPYRLTAMDQSIVRRTESGRNQTYEKPKVRQISVSWPDRLADTDANSLFRNIDWDSGLTSDLVFSLDEDRADALDNTMLCRVQQPDPLVIQIGGVSTKNYRLIENG